MIKMSTKVLTIASAAVILMTSVVVKAADEMKPFILASTGVGKVADTVNDVKEALTGNGFTIAGEYSPYETAHIL